MLNILLPLLGFLFVISQIFRREIGIFRECFNYIIGWYIGTKNNFAVAPGKMGKYFKNFLDERQYKLLCGTYSDSDYDNFWNAIFKMCELFRETAKAVAEYFNFEYIQSDDDNMTEYLFYVRNLQGSVLT